MIQTVAEMLRSVVDKHKARYPQEVKNDSVRLQHLKAVAGMLVEAVYELSTGREGAFAPVLFSASVRELATAQKKHSSENDNVSETPTSEDKVQGQGRRDSGPQTAASRLGHQLQQNVQGVPRSVLQTPQGDAHEHRGTVAPGAR